MIRRSSSAPLASLAAVCLCTLLACAADDGGDTGTSSSTSSAAQDTDAAATTTGSGDASTGDSPTTANATNATTATTGAETGEASTTMNGSTGGSTDASTGPAPTDGPGVLPGETGLEAFCRRYVECGGTFYEDAQACMDASLDYWGACETRRTALDGFGACMSELACTDWSPDAYNPASTPCAREWGEVGASEPCN